MIQLMGIKRRKWVCSWMWDCLNKILKSEITGSFLLVYIYVNIFSLWGNFDHWAHVFRRIGLDERDHMNHSLYFYNQPDDNVKYEGMPELPDWLESSWSRTAGPSPFTKGGEALCEGLGGFDEKNNGTLPCKHINWKMLSFSEPNRFRSLLFNGQIWESWALYPFSHEPETHGFSVIFNLIKKQ